VLEPSVVHTSTILNCAVLAIVVSMVLQSHWGVTAIGGVDVEDTVTVGGGVVVIGVVSGVGERG